MRKTQKRTRIKTQKRRRIQNRKYKKSKNKKNTKIQKTQKAGYYLYLDKPEIILDKFFKYYFKKSFEKETCVKLINKLKEEELEPQKKFDILLYILKNCLSKAKIELEDNMIIVNAEEKKVTTSLTKQDINDFSTDLIADFMTYYYKKIIGQDYTFRTKYDGYVSLKKKEKSVLEQSLRLLKSELDDLFPYMGIEESLQSAVAIQEAQPSYEDEAELLAAADNNKVLNQDSMRTRYSVEEDEEDDDDDFKTAYGDEENPNIEEEEVEKEVER